MSISDGLPAIGSGYTRGIDRSLINCQGVNPFHKAGITGSRERYLVREAPQFGLKFSPVKVRLF